MSFREGFTFSRSQKLGILFAFALFAIVISTIGLWKHFYQTSRDIEVFETKMIKVDTIKDTSYPKSKIYQIDINKADTTDWEQLPGIGKVLSKRIIKYREAIGGFHAVAELAHVYGLQPEVLSKIESYLTINPKTIPQNKKIRKKKQPSFAYLPDLDVNTANEQDFKQLPGIGETLSKRIVKFRNSKGGFNEVKEIKDVYGLSAEVFDLIAAKLYIDSASLPPPREWIAQNNRGLGQGAERENEKTPFPSSESTDFESAFEPIDLNQANAQQLEALPGIGEKLANRIINYRKSLGFYASVEQLKSVYGLSEQNYERMHSFLYARIPDVPSKKDLNTITTKQLAFYPFISEELAENITQLRKKLGWFEEWTEVALVDGMNEEIMEQMKLYFWMQQ